MHGGVKVLTPDGRDIVERDTVYTAAIVAGLTAGLSPQVPITYKSVDIKGLSHVLTESERIQALDGGLLALRPLQEFGFVVNQGINSLQKNTFLINPDGTSFEISVGRIADQLNFEHVEFFKQLEFIGKNVNTLNATELINHTKTFLESKVATSNQDNLILFFRNITAKLVDDTWFLNYEFRPNTPINKVFITGIMVN